ncbi:MAG TPA: trypsin-like peptidase domain-containing protein [Acidimicrobiia bacterium]|nr:trypsin-like peptidase domain-containing protein [Acidimicrobiia bacterium]
MTTPLSRGPSSLGGPYPEPPVEKRTDPWAIALGLLGGVLLGTGLTFAILGFVGVFEEPTPPTIPPAPTLTAPSPTAPAPTFGDEVSVASVAARVIPSTVAIEISSFLAGGSGSGVVYGDSGYIITNHHVIDVAGEVAVVFADGARFLAEIIGSDPVTDIGVLRVERQDMAPVILGSAESLSIGEPAVAVGNPLGLAGGPTVTTGVVSALDRTLEVTAGETLYGLVQTDAPIAPGSSGGALVDAAGRLIGITTAIAVSNIGPEGIGFAVPVDIAVGVANDLIETREVRHALMGIVGATAWADAAGAEFPVGVLIEEISAGSAYEEAGGQFNDVVVAIDGAEVRTIDGLIARLRRLRAGDTIPVRILRGDSETTLEVTMGLLNP